MEPVLTVSPVSVVLNGWESLTPPGWDTSLIHRRLAPSRCWYSFTYPGSMESWVSLGGKESFTNQFKSWQCRGLNWGPCGRKAEILPSVPTTPAQSASKQQAWRFHGNDRFRLRVGYVLAKWRNRKMVSDGDMNRISCINL